MKHTYETILRKIALTMLFSILITSSFYSKNHKDQNLIHLSSEGFANNNAIPQQFACPGSNTSPPLHWSNIPQKTESLAIICHESESLNGEKVHWIIYNIPPTTTSLDAQVDEESLGFTQGLNSFGEKGYSGPCPGPKSGRNHYIFTIYALNSKLSIPEKKITIYGKTAVGVSHSMLQKAMIGKIIGKGSLVGTYERKK